MTVANDPFLWKCFWKSLKEFEECGVWECVIAAAKSRTANLAAEYAEVQCTQLIIDANLSTIMRQDLISRDNYQV